MGPRDKKKLPPDVTLRTTLRPGDIGYVTDQHETRQSVQFVTMKGKRFALVNAEDWEALIEWLETMEDVDIAKQAMAALKAAGRDRERAGWLEWDAAEAELK